MWKSAKSQVETLKRRKKILHIYRLFISTIALGWCGIHMWPLETHSPRLSRSLVKPTSPLFPLPLQNWNPLLNSLSQTLSSLYLPLQNPISLLLRNPTLPWIEGRNGGAPHHKLKPELDIEPTLFSSTTSPWGLRLNPPSPWTTVAINLEPKTE